MPDLFLAFLFPVCGILRIFGCIEIFVKCYCTVHAYALLNSVSDDGDKSGLDYGIFFYVAFDILANGNRAVTPNGEELYNIAHRQLGVSTHDERDAFVQTYKIS